MVDAGSILEKIIRYEAVHEIRDWEDLRRRIDLPDRRCYAFFHPALVDEPLIFVEVALTREIPGAIAPILSDRREAVDRRARHTAVFYSITNCQRGLAGVTFGHFLIKQVVEEVQPRAAAHLELRDAVAGAEFRRVAQSRAHQRSLDRARRGRSRSARRAGRPRLVARSGFVYSDPRAVLRAAAWYYLRGRNSRGLPVDAVAASISATARGLNGSIGSATRPSGRCSSLMA